MNNYIQEILRIIRTKNDGMVQSVMIFNKEGILEYYKKGDENLGNFADEVVGNRIRVKIVKNKVAPPFKKVELDLMFNEGISYTASLLDAAMKYGLIVKSGSWFSLDGEKIGQGRDKTVDYLKEHTDVAAALDKQLRERMFSPDKQEPPAAGEAKGSVTDEPIEDDPLDLPSMDDET